MVGCFGVLAAVALALAIEGAETCGCFGRAHVSPWYMCGFDPAAALAVWLIAGTRVPSPTIVAAPRRFAVTLVLALVVGSISTVCMVGSGPKALGASGPGGSGAVAGRTGAPSDPADQCWLAGARMILAGLGLDPRALDSLKANDVDGVLKAIGEKGRATGSMSGRSP